MHVVLPMTQGVEPHFLFASIFSTFKHMQLNEKQSFFQFFFVEWMRLDETFQGGANGFLIGTTVFESSLKN